MNVSATAPALPYLLHPCNRSAPVILNGLSYKTGSDEIVIREPLYVFAVSDLLNSDI